MNGHHEQHGSFREVQRFGQLWLWALLTPLAGFTWFLALYFLVLRRPFGTQLAPEGTVLIVWLVSGVGVPLLFLLMQMITEVRHDGVYVRFVPFHFSFRRFGFAGIASAEARTYRPILEYGGWGIRFSFRRGKAYNVRGNRGVQLVFKNGKRLLIGSQRADDLARAIQRGLSAA